MRRRNHVLATAAALLASGILTFGMLTLARSIDRVAVAIEMGAATPAATPALHLAGAQFGDGCGGIGDPCYVEVKGGRVSVDNWHLMNPMNHLWVSVDNWPTRYND